MITRDDVVRAYKMFLGRLPESEQAIASHIESANNWSELRRVITGSSEFRSKPKKYDAVIVGNCQSGPVSQILSIASGLNTKAIETRPNYVEDIGSGDTYVAHDLLNADIILVHDFVQQSCDHVFDQIGIDQSRLRKFPAITFSGFHPDMTTVDHVKTGTISGFSGPYQSRLAYYGYSRGLLPGQTISLFRPEVFSLLGYHEFLPTLRQTFAKQGVKTGYPLAALLQKWLSRRTCFMHTFNHPKSYVLESLVNVFLENEGIPHLSEAGDHVLDSLANHPSWLPYPEVAKRFGFESNYGFKSAGALSTRQGKVVDLPTFVQLSYDAFERYGRDNLLCPGIQTEEFSALDQFLGIERNKGSVAGSVTGQVDQLTPMLAIQPDTAPGVPANPYKGLPEWKFWRRAVAMVRKEDLDPVINPRFTISAHDKVATAGSCFAQHISKTLAANKFNYYVAEDGAGLNGEERWRRNYGVFSARYGNLYTSRQLCQLFNRAYGLSTFSDDVWLMANGNYCDPFRPQIEPDGFASREALLEERGKHLLAVKEMFEGLDVFVFTLGLTEAWRNKADGAIVPVAPGVAGGGEKREQYEFVNFSVDDVVADLQVFIDLLKSVNEAARIILTVSPVPLIATYSDSHVLTATTYSKSVLRVSADMMKKANSHVEYFPSYEIITGNHVGNGYYESDLRSVRQEGVDHVMGLFMRHYANSGVKPVDRSIDERAETFKIDLLRDIGNQAKIVCDEEAIDKSVQ